MMSHLIQFSITSLYEAVFAVLLMLHTRYLVYKYGPFRPAFVSCFRRRVIKSCPAVTQDLVLTIRGFQ